MLPFMSNLRHCKVLQSTRKVNNMILIHMLMPFKQKNYRIYILDIPVLLFFSFFFFFFTRFKVILYHKNFKRPLSGKNVYLWTTV